MRFRILFPDYNYFRDYDPVIGRYSESDPTGLDGGMNPYLYANGNPLAYVDPFGLYCLSEATIDAIGGGAGGLVTGLFFGGIPGHSLA